MTVHSRNPRALLRSTALSMLLLSGSLSPALADGGAGGGGTSGAHGGAGGTLDNPQGGDGGSAAIGGGGGGGGGAGGGAGSGGQGGGGDGGEHGFVGGSLPTSDVIGEAGGNGGDGAYFGGSEGDGGGGGGAGGYGAILDSGGTAAVAIDQTIYGGSGGNGGSGGGEAAGGGGGDGGLGVSFSSESLTNEGTIGGGAGGVGMGSAGGPGGRGGDGGLGLSFVGEILTNSGTISGGAGGDGGPGDDFSDNGVAGRGGDGGMGISFTGEVLTNTGAISGGAGGDGGYGPDNLAGDGGVGISISAGTLINASSIAGGAGGVVDGDDSAYGMGGTGIVGADLVVINSGTISGGLAGDGTTRANAITFTGGSNRLVLQAGSAITGDVDASSSSSATFALGGADDFTFDVTAFGTSFLGFTDFEKSGTSRWLLTGATAATMDWKLDDGVLSIADAASLGSPDGTLAFDGGTLQIDADASLSQTVQLEAGGGTFDTGSTSWVELGGDIAGPGGLTKAGEGALFLSGNNDYSGDTHVQEGIFLTLTNTGLSKNSAHMLEAGTILVVEAGVDASIGSLAGAGTVGAGALLTGPASLTTGFDGTDTTFSGTIVDGVGSLSLTKTGTGTFTLSGVNGYTGPTIIDGGVLAIADGGSIVSAVTVNSGLLSVNGTAAGVTVNAGAMLGGSGTVGATTITAGGVHAPGNSPGTQTINGSYINRGTLEVEVTPTLSDRLVVNGTVDISGATLSLLLSPDSASDWNIDNGPFTIIANDGTDAIIGVFDPVTKNLLFLDERLDYAGGDGNDVTLELTRNDVDFDSVAITRNQKATAGGIDSLGNGSPIWNAIAMQTDEDVTRAAFDQLSGEVHASAKNVLIGDSHFVRDAATDRIRAAFGTVGANSMPVLAYGEDGTVLASADTLAPAAWGWAFGAWTDLDGDGNAASLSSSTGGFLTGVDAALSENWRAGILAGYSYTSFDIGDRSSSGSSQNWHFGLYGGGQWQVGGGTLGLRGGAAYTWHDIETTRQVAFPGLADSLSGDYRAGTAQVFGEVAYDVKAGAIGLEPFANLAYVNLHTSGFSENASGGAGAALASASSDTDVTFVTLGLRASTSFTLGSINATARGMLGWRHAYGNTTPLSTFAFAGSDSFVIAGIPIARDAALVEAGFDLNLSPNATLGLSYQGQFASHANQNGFNARLKVAF